MNTQQTTERQATQQHPSIGQPSCATRIGCLLAAALATALCLGTQLGLADAYTAQADAVYAAQRSPAVAQAVIDHQNQGRQARRLVIGCNEQPEGKSDEPGHQRADTPCQRG